VCHAFPTGPILAALGGMCLTCGCMDAHLQMGRSNIMYEDLKAAADENGRSVAETIDIMERTIAKDRDEHPPEYKA
jgi:pyruvate/2-oxoglutarate dehydrogenase complex dihydrolipoamide dehydrogenase (E3) component